MEPPRTWAGSGFCGVATNLLDYNDGGMVAFCSSNLDFWWNWARAPKNIYSSPCAWQKYVPMVWGYSPDNSRNARSAAPRLMGYNEPDLWGPPAVPGGHYLASGTFAPTFHCGSTKLALNWQELVMAYKMVNPAGLVLSPAMADAGSSGSVGDYSRCDASPQLPSNHMDYCDGWLKCFKQQVIQLPCGNTNCWDLIDILQFHDYAYTAEDLILKVQTWESAWAEDLRGLAGRSKKTLWLTEFARAGAVDARDPDGRTREFIHKSVEYLKASPYVSGWSWFSQDTTTFKSFPIGGVPPAEPFWSSELIDRDGHITVIGEAYVRACTQ